MKKLLALAVVLVLAVGWYLFRPELLFLSRQVSEPAPTGPEAKLTFAGSFASHAHTTAGAAQIYELEGRHTLRLQDFETSNGPDVRVYLVVGPDASSVEAVKKAGFLDLGALKGNVGDQNYAIPAGTDLAKYGSVSIWCRRFGVNFASARLQPAD